MNKTVMIVLILALGYVLGAKFPMIAAKVGIV